MQDRNQPAVKRRPTPILRPHLAEALESRTLLCGDVDDSATVHGPHFMFSVNHAPPATPTAKVGLAAVIETPQLLAASALLTSGWASQDVGAVAAAGSAAQGATPDTFAVSGSGVDVQNGADEFHFAYSQLAGDGQIVARIDSLQNTDPWAKVGVMFRESLATDSKNTFALVTPANGINFTGRAATGGGTVNYGSYKGVTAPYWLKLVRSGNTFIAQRSTDGASWTTVASTTISMSSTLYVGLAVTSHKDGTLNTAQFSGVAITSGSVATPTQLTVQQASATSATLTWTDNSANETLFRIQRSTNGGTSWVDAGTSASNAATFTDTGLTAGTNYSYRVRAENGSTASGYSNIVTFKLAAVLSLAGTDIGAVGAVGSNTVNAAGVYTVSGSGADIAGNIDAFRFVQQTLNGDGQIIARVDSLQNTDPWAKAGIMFRDTLAANAKNINLFVTPSQGVNITGRMATGALGANYGKVVGITAPRWLKLTRIGNTFTGWHSADGANWTQVASVTMSMGTTAYVGLSVTSHKAGTLNTAQFSNVAISVPTSALGAPSQLAAQQISANAVRLTWTDNATTETLFRIQRSTNNGSTWSNAGTTAANATTWTDGNRVAGTIYQYRVRAENGSAASAYSPAIAFSLSAVLALTGGDVGTVSAAGSNSITSGGVFTVTGSGADVFGKVDGFRYVQQTMNGDGSIIARVTSVQNVDPWTKAGLMIRETTDPGSRNVFVMVTPGQGVALTARPTVGASSYNYGTVTGITAPVWLKLVRAGNVFTASYSTNGTTWTVVGSVTVAMSNTTNVGLAVTAHKQGALATATFDNVSRTGVDPMAGWLALAETPIPRYEHAGLAVAGKLYAFGGFYNTDIQATTRSDVYDPATNTWTRIADMPEALTHVGHATDGRYVFLIGGFVGDYSNGMPTTNHAWRYDTQTNTWLALPNLPQAVGAGAAAIVGRTLYFYGGTTRSGGRYVADSTKAWSINLDNTAAGWTEKKGLAVARNHLGGVTIGGLIYAVGGQLLGSEIVGNSRIVSVYNPSTNTWGNVASLPLPTGHIVASTFVYNGKLRVIGGVTQDSVELDTMYEYNPATNIWTLVGTIPGKRQSPLADQINGVIYVSGGFEPGIVYTSTYRTA